MFFNLEKINQDKFDCFDEIFKTLINWLQMCFFLFSGLTLLKFHFYTKVTKIKPIFQSKVCQKDKLKPKYF